MDISWTDNQCHSFLSTRNILYLISELPCDSLSALTQKLRKVHPDCLLICCEDYGEINRSDQSHLTETARERTPKSPMAKAADGCRKGVNNIIVGSTYFTRGDVQLFSDMAYQYDYIVVLTSLHNHWIGNLDENCCRFVCQETTDITERGSRTYDKIVPYYFGWFFSREESLSILKNAQDIFHACFKNPAFPRMFSNVVDDVCYLHCFELYSMKNSSSPSQMLHVTTSFTNNGKCPWADSYASHVSAFHGNVTNIEVVGYVLTARSFALRVRLSKPQRNCWGKQDDILETESLGVKALSRMELIDFPVRDFSPTDDDFKLPKDKSSFSVGSGNIVCPESSEKNATVTEMVSEIGQTDDTFLSKFKDHAHKFHENFKHKLGNSYVIPSFELGCTAHITVGCRDNWKPVISGDDLRKIIVHELLSTPNTEFLTDSFLAHEYDYNTWVVYLKESFLVPAVFSGRYLYMATA